MATSTERAPEADERTTLFQFGMDWWARFGIAVALGFAAFFGVWKLLDVVGL